MTTFDCAVCRIKSTCGADGTYLYAPTAILSQRLSAVLLANGVPFSLHERTFAIAERAEGPQALDVLRRELSEPEADDLRVSFDLSSLMGAASLSRTAQRIETRWFEVALTGDHFVHWFQPIVDVRRDLLIGHECLIRLANTSAPGSFYNGGEIIDAALTRGDLHVFDSYSRRTAIRNAAQQMPEGRIFVNFMPSSIYDPAFCMASTLAAMEGTQLRPRDIVFEVVESERVRDPRHLRKIVDFYRERGFGVALDDVGTGSNTLQMMSEIQPDFIKLDKSIVGNCDTLIGRKTIQKLAEIGADTNMAVIAEGVETEHVRDVLLESGVSLMQGYLFGRPSPAVSRMPAVHAPPADAAV